MTRPHPYHAVVTGDIVGSGRLTPAAFRQVQGAITRAGKDLAKQFPGALPLPIELARGDSWQLYLPDPVPSLRIALYVRAFIRARAERADTRFAIGVGGVDTKPKKSVGDGRGEAFRLSGDLVEKKRGSRMRFAIAPGPPEAWWRERSINAALTALDVTASKWTSAQATAVCGALLGGTQAQIAEGWPGKSITQQSAGQHLARAGWDGVAEVIGYYEDVMTRISE